MIAKKLLTTIAFAFVLLFSGCAEDDFEGVDGLCPLVVSTVPEDGAIDVPLNQVITATFNEKMNPATITKTSFTISANGTLIDGAVSYNGLTATFDPTLALEPDTEYTGTITTMAKDERGNALQENYVWTFTTLPEYEVRVLSNPTTGPMPTGAGIFIKGTAVTITAQPYAGYTFTNWTVNGVQVYALPSYTFVLMDDIELVANYTLIPYQISLLASPTAGGTPTGAGFYNFGATATVTANPSNGYNFVNWTENGAVVQGAGATYAFTVTGTRTLQANYTAVISQFTITLNSDTNQGTTLGAGTFNSGSTRTVEAIAQNGYTFSNWTENNVIVPLAGANYQFVLTQNRNLTANFTPVIQPPVNAGLCPNPAVDLGLAGNYAILAESAISTTGVTSVTGDMGISPLAASFITGFGLILDSSGTYSTSSLVTGKVYAADYASPTPSNLTTTVDNMHTAFTTANGLAPNFTEYLAGNLNNVTLPAGVYKYGTGLLLSNTITLDGGGVDCAAFVFQIAGDLTVANNVKIVLINGAKADNIFWVTAGAGAVIGSDVDFSGNVLSKTLISVEARSSVKGRLLAQSAVSLIGNIVVKPSN